MFRSLLLGVVLLYTPVLLAQEATVENGEVESGKQPAKAEQGSDEGVKTDTIVTQETAMEQEVPAELPDYDGDFWKREKFTGSWGGVRNDLAAKGITLDIDVTQSLMKNLHGGKNTSNAVGYIGSTDYTLTLDTGKMGLWPGGTILLNAENIWGNSAATGLQPDIGSLMPVNLDAHKPTYGEGCTMTLSEFILFQALFEGKVVLVAGKLDGSRAFDRNVFANDERTQFMNLAFRNNPVIPAFLPYTTLGLGVIVNPTDWLTISTAVADSEGQAKRTGFDTAFHGPTHTTVIHEYSLKIEPFGLPGNQRVGFIWSSKEYPYVSPISPFKETGPLLRKVVGEGLFAKIGKVLPYKHSKDNVAVYYNFDQYLYQEADDPTQGLGLFGRFGWARQDVNPVAHFYSLGVGGKGIIPERDNDTYGLGYYFVDLSNDLPNFLHSEQGIEMYYNYELTPWMHITQDFQIIMDPGGHEERECALVAGVRFQMNL